MLDEQEQDKDRATAERVIFHHSLSKVGCLDPHLTVFMCYDFEDDAIRHRVIDLAEDLVSSGINENNVYFDHWINRPGSNTTIFQHWRKIKEAQKVLLIGSPRLKRQVEETEGERGVASQQIENLLTRKLHNGVDGIIPCWFEGTKEENIPFSLLSLPGRALRTNGFLSFFELLIDLYGGSVINHPIKKAQREFDRKRRILTSNLLAQYTDQLQGYRQETDVRLKQEVEELLTNQLLKQKAALREEEVIDKAYKPSRKWHRVIGNPLWLLPEGNENFLESIPYGSEDSYLDQLWKQLHTSRSVTITSCTIAGLGGVGKTQLALAYAHEARKEKAYQYIHWIHSETSEQIIEDYKKLLTKLGFKNIDPLSDEEIIIKVKEELPNKYEKWLLIYDNAPDYEAIKGKLPSGDGHILITSRCAVGWKKLPLNLDIWQPEEAVEYLLKNSGQKETEENRKSALEVAEAVGCLPLALSHAASYIRNDRHMTFKKYIKKFKEKKEEILAYKPKTEGEHPHTPLTTWTITMEKLSPEAQRLLHYFAYMGPDNIPYPSFYSSMGKKAVKQGIDELINYSMIKSGEEKVISLHRLVQQVGRLEQQKSSTHTSPDLEAIQQLKEIWATYWQETIIPWQNKFKNHQALSDEELAKVYKCYKVASSLIPHFLITRDFLKNSSYPKKGAANYSIMDLNGLHLSLEHFIKEGRKRVLEFYREEDSSVNYAKLTQEEIGITLDTYKEFTQLVNSVLKRNFKENFYYHIRALLSLTPTKQAEILSRARSLIEDDMNEEEFAIIINCIQSLVLNHHEETLREVEDLIQNLENFDKAITTEVSAYFSIEKAKQLQPLLPSLVTIITPRMKSMDRLNIIEALLLMKPFYSERILSLKGILTEEMTADDRLNVIKALSSIQSEQQLEEIITYLLKKLNLSHVRGPTRAKAVKELIVMDIDQRNIFIELQPLIKKIGLERCLSTTAYLSKIDPSYREEMIEKVLHFQKDKQALQTYLEVIKITSNFTNFETEKKGLHIKIYKFMTKSITPDEQARVIEALSNCTNKANEAFLELFLSDLPLEKMTGQSRIKLSQAIERLGDKAVETFKKLQKYNIITQEMDGENMDGENQVAIIETVSNLGGTAPLILEQIDYYNLIEPSMNGYERFLVIKVFSTVGIEKYKDVFNWAKQVVMPSTGTKKANQIIEVLVQIDPLKRESIMQAQALFQEYMDIDDCLKIVEAVSKVELQQRENIKYARNLFSDNMKGEDYAHIVEAFSEIEPQQRENVIEYAKKISSDNMRGYDYARIINIVSKIEPQQRENVIEHAKMLSSDNMRGYDYPWIIEAVSKIEPQQRENVIEHAKMLSSDNMSGDDYAWIIEAVSKIEPQQRENVIEHAKMLSSDNMRGYYYAKLIISIARQKKPKFCLIS